MNKFKLLMLLSIATATTHMYGIEESNQTPITNQINLDEQINQLSILFRSDVNQYLTDIQQGHFNWRLLEKITGQAAVINALIVLKDRNKKIIAENDTTLSVLTHKNLMQDLAKIEQIEKINEILK